MSMLDNRGDLVNGVERAELGTLGERDDLGLGSMLIAPTSGLQLDQLGSQLVLRCRGGQQLKSADPLGRTTLVEVDVRGLCADDRIPALCHRLKRDEVGACPIEDGIRRGLGAKMLPKDALKMLGVYVCTIGPLVSAVSPGDGL